MYFAKQAVKVAMVSYVRSYYMHALESFSKKSG